MSARRFLPDREDSAAGGQLRQNRIRFVRKREFRDEAAGKSWMREPVGTSRLRSSSRQSPVLLNSAAQVATESGKRPTAMFVGRESGVQSRWPERLRAVRRRKPRYRHISLETEGHLLERKPADGPRPYLKPERARDNKERQTVDGLPNSGSRLRNLGTRKTSSQGEVRRKTSGNGRGHKGRHIHRNAYLSSQFRKRN